jgi:antitoxin HicB
MLRQQVKPAELARRLNISRQEVTRLNDIRHTTKIDAIAGAMTALGKTLELRVA